MAQRVVGQLTGDALEEFQQVVARFEALRLNPSAFSQSESVEIVLQHTRVLGRIIADFGVDPSLEWSVNPSTGAVEVEV